jgi:hypothetical protein
MHLLSSLEQAILVELCSMRGFQLTGGALTRETAVGVIRKMRSALPPGAFQVSAVLHLMEVLYSSEMNDAELRSAAGLTQRLGSRSLTLGLLDSGVAPEDVLEVVERITWTPA